MAFQMSEAQRADWAKRGDRMFPDVRGTWTSDRTLLAELPKAGTGLWVLCCGCWDQRWIGGRDICRRWPDWLMRPGVAWANALRCRCGARRFRFMAERDPEAAGFIGAVADDPTLAFARRLKAWLTPDGPSLDDLAPRLAAMPTLAQIRAAGL